MGQTTDPPSTERSSVFDDPRNEAQQLRQRIDLLERQLRERANQVRLVSLRPPPDDPPPRSALGRVARRHPWAMTLGAIATLLGAATPTILAAIDVARLRGDLATVQAERKTEATELQGFRQRTQQWQESEGPKLRELDAEVVRLRSALTELRAQPRDKRRPTR